MRELAGQRILEMCAAHIGRAWQALGDDAAGRLDESVANRVRRQQRHACEPADQRVIARRRQPGSQADQRPHRRLDVARIAGSAQQAKRPACAARRHGQGARAPPQNTLRPAATRAHSRHSAAPRCATRSACAARVSRGRAPRGGALRAHADLPAIAQRDDQRSPSHRHAPPCAKCSRRSRNGHATWMQWATGGNSGDCKASHAPSPARFSVRANTLWTAPRPVRRTRTPTICAG